MRKKKKFNLRVGKTDGDIVSVLTLPDGDRYFKGAIRAHIQKLPHGEYKIPLNEHYSQPTKPAIISIYFSATQDKDIVDWLASLPQGSATAVVKTLIRHYLECPDLRPHLSPNPDFQMGPRARRTQQKARSPLRPAASPSPASVPSPVSVPSEEFTTPAEPTSSAQAKPSGLPTLIDEDSLFDMI